MRGATPLYDHRPFRTVAFLSCADTMRSASAALNLVLAVSVATPSSAFMPARNVVSSPPSVLHTSNDGREKQWTVDETTEDSEALPMGMDKFNIPNPLVELGNMFSNFDDVIDDFFFKRVSTAYCLVDFSLAFLDVTCANFDFDK